MNKEQYLPRELGLYKGKKCTTTNIGERVVSNTSKRGMEGSNSSSTLFPSPSIPSVIRFTRSSKLIQSSWQKRASLRHTTDVRKNAQGGRGAVASVIAAA